MRICTCGHTESSHMWEELGCSCIIRGCPCINLKDEEDPIIRQWKNNQTVFTNDLVESRLRRLEKAVGLE